MRECERARERYKKKSPHYCTVLHTPEPNQGKYNAMTNKPSVKQQHINQTDVCVKQNRTGTKIPNFTLVLSSSMIHHVHIVMCRMCVCECDFVCMYVCAYVYIPSIHKYTTDIIELAIKRKAKWISKAHITYTYDSHLNTLVRLCVFVCLDFSL